MDLDPRISGYLEGDRHVSPVPSLRPDAIKRSADLREGMPFKRDGTDDCDVGAVSRQLKG